MRYGLLFLLTFLLMPGWNGQAQRMPEPPHGYDPALFDTLQFRMIGPFRGGRSTAVTGVRDQPLVHYFGGTGGGVWKSTDGGQSWQNISDGFFGGSIGAIAVSEWDPNVIYVGGGEESIRGNVSHGYGMWKSTDGGKTWTFIGLPDSRHIGDIVIHPRNPDLVYVAVMGHAFGPNEERGVYRSKDGGKTWERILFVSEDVGAVDLAMDPTNPRILYATLWRFRRTPYSFESGGEGSGLWKSTDGGDTWVELTHNPGMPEPPIGKIGITVSADPDRLYAIVEAHEGGVFRSDDGGKTWRRVNDDRNLRQRAWYYSHIVADPKDPDVVYVLNVGFWKSKDGGRTFTRIRTPHGDHHDLWIDPDDPRHMIIADDGGAQVTYDGGETWTTYYNQPTAQFYRVTTDNVFPYRIYGAQQDNSTVRIYSRSDGPGISERDWEPTAGGESGWLAPDPKDPEIVYGGSYGGYLERYDHRTRQRRRVDIWPDNPMGHGAKDLKYRFNWNFPILFSRHDPNVLYAAANVLFKTTNEGQRWEQISPDLTRNDTTKMGPSGGPITKDNTSVEYYGTIFALAESVHEPGVIWTGSDDGLIYLTRDGGKTWQNVTPPPSIMPEWIQINSIEPDPFNPGGLYVAATMYKWDDFRPYLYKTKDYGRTWQKITNGIAADHFTRVIRADPERPGLLYAGTESGLYISFDDGEHWQRFQLNLPIVPITDLAIKGTDLIVATQGRSFWVLDHLEVLRQLTPELARQEVILFKPKDTYRLRGSFRRQPPGGLGENPPAGVVIFFYLKEKPDTATVVKLEILEEDGDVIRTFATNAKKRSDRLEVRAGSNKFVWDMRYPDAEGFEGLIMWAASLRGPLAPPGTYRVRLTVGDQVHEQTFRLLKDPRSKATDEDLQAQFAFLMEVRDKLSEVHRAIKHIREIRQDVREVIRRLPDDSTGLALQRQGRSILQKLTQVEEALYQTKNRAPQDPLNFPIRLNNKLAALMGVVGTGDFRPTDQAIAVKNELVAQIDDWLARYQEVIERELSAFNEAVLDLRLPPVAVPVLSE
ncbi:MAG: glycosyl hydrolase [Rhodothermus sp.]|nr:glycosyl hydrolase [Rhodothermus sp.]